MDRVDYKPSYTSVLQLSGAPALEDVSIAIGGQAKRVPEAKRSLHAELVLEGTQGRIGVLRESTSPQETFTKLSSEHNSRSN